MNNLNNISQNEFETIEAYINGQLSTENLAAFENRLTSEDGFSLKVEAVKTILIGIETQALKEQLNAFHNELLNKNNTSSMSQVKVKTLNWKKIAVAAVLIIGLGSFWIFNNNSNESLYAEYFTPDPGLPTTMSNSDNYEFYEAMVDYKQGKYETAISKWENLLKAKPENDTLNYFIGVAHLANKNEITAISFLEDASKNSNFPLINDTYYYLGLAYLKKGEVSKAKNNLENATTESSKILLSKLKN